MKLIAMIAALAALTATASAQTLTDTNLVLDQLLPQGTLDTPTNMEFIGQYDILINEKGTGKVRRVTNGVIAPDPVLDLPVNNDSERGLLGMALDPSFPTSPYVYLYYTAAATDNATPIANRVSRFTWNGTTLGEEALVIDLPVLQGPNHDGGIIRFGPPNVAPADQKLFIIIGDLNRNNQTENYANSAPPDNTAVVVRINRDGSFPTDGPFYSVAGTNDSLKTMYAYGIRNSFGMDFDPVTNALWDTENGPNSNDEINRIDPGFNSGWETIMGPAPTPLPTLVQFSGVGTYSDPEFTWNRIVAPTAIHFFRSAALGTQNLYDCFVGCNNNGKLYHFELNPERTTFELTGPLADHVWQSTESDDQIVFGENFGIIGDIDTGPDGNMYLLDLALGTIFRITPNPTAVDEWALYE